MELRKILFRKEAKLVTLLLTAMLIASASAQLYYSLTMTSTIAVYAADVYFVVGSDNGTKGLDVTLGSNATTVTLTGLRAYPNASFTYTNATLVRNNGAVNASVRLAPDSITNNAPDFVYVRFLLNATNVGDRRWLNYTSNGGSWSNTGASSWTTLQNATQWSIVIMTMANATATTGNTVTIGITVDVD